MADVRAALNEVRVARTAVQVMKMDMRRVVMQRNAMAQALAEVDGTQQQHVQRMGGIVQQMSAKTKGERHGRPRA